VRSQFQKSLPKKKHMIEKIISGDVISPGVSRGTIYFIDYYPTLNRSSKLISQEMIQSEVDRFKEAIQLTVSELEKVIKTLETDLFHDEAEIVNSHVFLLKDHKFHQQVVEKIKSNHLASEIAVDEVIQEFSTILINSNHTLFLERAVDLKDIGLQVRRQLQHGVQKSPFAFLADVQHPVIATRELLPSLVLEGYKSGVKGMIVTQGALFSHAGILAKSFGIPVLKVENLFTLGIEDKADVIVDANKGHLLIHPESDDVDDRLIKNTNSNNPDLVLPIDVWMNIVDPQQVTGKDVEAVGGIGLYRTEILFMNQEYDFPTEEEQIEVYAGLFDTCGDYPVTIRTLDIGGDKTLSYFSFGPQENPYLGFRAHRIFRFHPEIFITQVRAILLAAVNTTNLRILYPMIESVDELHFVQGLLQKAIEQLNKEGKQFNQCFQQGVLIEVPSAVWNFGELLKYVDFASVGTNDLFQYIFAVDRNNANVFEAYQPENPVAIKILKNLADTAKQSGKSIGLCGEIAAYANFLPILLGIGFDMLSIDHHAIPQTRQFLSSLDPAACKNLVSECLEDLLIALTEFFIRCCYNQRP